VLCSWNGGVGVNASSVLSCGNICVSDIAYLASHVGRNEARGVCGFYAYVVVNFLSLFCNLQLWVRGHFHNTLCSKFTCYTRYAKYSHHAVILGYVGCVYVGYGMWVGYVGCGICGMWDMWDMWGYVGHV
jgi:hypothetical protein